MSISPADKNILYNAVKTIIDKTGGNSVIAAQDIVLMFEQYIDDRDLEEEEQTKGKISPIFRRSQ